ncbi:sensor histidine kinase [Mangrovivirga cuniculi]|uniref:Signal transduction histidine kinase internal region domain-containing protein n=1 Tax=Mangrovivirga cuniculi TaxID=2715131 RepID=A0A4D7JYS1_9BACT|nr:histidine kinase [Mangrovivirga cuniculi]QCK13824.1 hypothetical protein DCC35_03135 [Mangrovivirga cuniculi]
MGSNDRYDLFSIGHEKKFSELRGVIRMIIIAGVLILIHLISSNIAYFLAKKIYSSITLIQFINVLNDALLPSLFGRIIDLTIIFFLLSIVESKKAIQEKKLRIAQLEKQVSEISFKALKAQLNPHFLFNSLHSLNSLIGIDDKKARKMVLKISDLLRKMLQHQGHKLIPLKKELNYVNDYLDIEKERFSDRLEIDFQIDSATENIAIPPFLLQPLIENSFKHGISKIEGKGKISLTTKLENDMLRLSLSNSIPEDLSSDPNSIGIGLSNLQHRLTTLNPENKLTFTRANNSYTANIILRNISQL